MTRQQKKQIPKKDMPHRYSMWPMGHIGRAIPQGIEHHIKVFTTELSPMPGALDGDSCVKSKLLPL